MSGKRTFTNLYHPDIAIFLILIPFISAFNYYLTYSNIRLSFFLLLTFTLDTVQGYLAWWAVRYYIFFLDKRWPFEKGFLSRIIIQLFGSLLIGLLIISTLTELVSWIAKGKAAPLNFYAIDLFIISIWFFVITGIYTGLRYYNLWQHSEAARQEENRAKSEGLVVKQGKQEIRLSFEELAGFYVDDDYAVACHVSGKKYYMGQSLDKIEKTLPTSIFFRLNRQFILHRRMISGFSRSENGKILVMPHRHDNFPSEILISRTKAPSFKAWFRPEA
ncbi:MAG: LytTR family transcriptional regulator DNA-binding domain-containing protein [Bacteroidota bacterium]